MYDKTKQYARFLDSFGTHHSFQTFGDKGLNKMLIKQFHGTIEQHLDQLWALNERGAGVFLPLIKLICMAGLQTTSNQSVQYLLIWTERHYLANLNCNLI